MRWLLLLPCLLTHSATAAEVKPDSRLDWWAFQPLKKPVLPGRAAHPVDDFIQQRLAAAGLEAAPPASAQVLIRRLFFDLTGLPPTPEEVRRYAALPYEQLVGDLLASPRYGERWARHWLDLVHYGETHGYDKDKPRLNAWPYRDYVIRALNQDKPYARFVQEQIAGDALYPGTTDGITALGFLAAGPWDLIGHMEVPETKLDGKIARHLDRDDMVQNTLGTFCSLTVQCAQCHYHKFDPISQQDYYALQAVFAGIDRTEIDYYPNDVQMQQHMAQRQRRQQLEAAVASMEKPLIEKAGKAYQALTQQLQGAAEKGSNPNSQPDYGYHSQLASEQTTVKWVQVDLGRSVEIQRILLKPCYDDFGSIGGGFGFPIRFKIEASDDPLFRSGVTLLWRKHDATFMNDFQNPGLSPFETNTAGDDGVKGRYVRVTAVKLAPRSGVFILALAELEVYESKTGPNLAADRPVTALDNIEAPPRWRRQNLTDGLAPESRSEQDKKQLHQQRDALLLAQADQKTRTQLLAMRQQLQKLPTPPPAQKIYAGAVHYGSGTFRGTHGTPRTIHVLKRGDIQQPAEQALPASISAISQHLKIAFSPADHGEASRRAALARWITEKENALTWRSIVNRVWQHHFGRGLVDTANDMGRMGSQPSHPELLDWLAVTFRDDFSGSLKELHKLILTSHTYRQSSARSAQAQMVEGGNQLLSHQNRRKLDAESIRDTILSVSGKLDLSMGGPSFQDFTIEKPQHSPHYQYHLHDPEDAKSHRRSIYRFIVRSQQQPFMTVLDCADPSMRVEKRNESLSPLQALALMNNGLSVSMARHFATRVGKDSPTDLPAQIHRAFSLALAREPQPEELPPLLDYARQQGLENTCRVLLNLNEFSFVD